MPRGAKPGERRGGRAKGTRNKRTQERQREFAATGRKDPLESQLDLHEWALRGFKKACADLAAFEKKHRKTLDLAAVAVKPTDEQKAVAKAHDRIRESVDAFAGKIHAYAMGATPFLHARLASTEAKVEVTNHEAALDELDDDEEVDD